MKKQLTLLALGVVVLSLASCNGKSQLEKYQDKIELSLNKVVRVHGLSTITDGTEVVYSDDLVIEITYGENDTLTGIATNAVTTFGTGFAYETTTSTSSFTGTVGDTTTLLNFSLDKNYFSSYTLKNDQLEGVIKAENFKDVFKIASNIDMSGVTDASLSIAFEENNLKSVVASYVSAQDATVSMSYEFTY